MNETRRLTEYVTQALLPKWRIVGVDPAQGCFQERLDLALTPIDMGYQRLLVQCRQIFSFSEGAVLGCPSWARQVASDGFDFMLAKFWDKRRGGWVFSLGEGGAFSSATRHLYAHAFVILACSAYFRATGERDALQWAERTLEFIQRHFRGVTNHGFVTALDGKLLDLRESRQQNPHMHLFEACMMMYELTSQEEFAQVVEEIISLLLDAFVEPRTGTLTEYFDDQWLPDAAQGDVLEPGHHVEWVWLIHRWLWIAREKSLVTREDELREVADRLLSWAIKFGIDTQYGGVFGEVNRQGAVVNEAKRIWPLVEAIKALRFVSVESNGRPQVSGLADKLSQLLFARYIGVGGDDGTWVEFLARDLQPLTNYMPGSTPYHIVMAARELSWLSQRVQNQAIAAASADQPEQPLPMAEGSKISIPS